MAQQSSRSLLPLPTPPEEGVSSAQASFIKLCLALKFIFKYAQKRYSKNLS